MRPSALDRKLLRDLRQTKGQALAIALVIGAAVAMSVMYGSSFDSLRRAQLEYYARCAFGDLFVSLERAPEQLAGELRELPGVARVATRIVALVTLDVPGFDEPVRGRIASVPAPERPTVNDLVLRAGRWVEPERGDEVLANEAFAQAHGLGPGDSIVAVLNGKRRELRIVGIALSPEHVYSIPARELIADERRFGILWMERDALAAAYDMEGGFNEASLVLQAGTSPEPVIDALDRMLAPYGSLGAIPRRLQPSHFTLESEIGQLRRIGVLVPAIFLSVAGFLLNVAMTRTLAIERSQIAMLKALGYASHEIAWHYLKWALCIAALGAVIGILGGLALGRGLLELYNQHFRFPSSAYALDYGAALGATSASLIAAAAGAGLAVLRAVRLAPADALRPPVPAQHGASLLELRWLDPLLRVSDRMLLRNFGRHPVRAMATMLGVSFAIGVLIIGFVYLDAMQRLGDGQYADVQREDVSIAFAEPTSGRVLHELAAWPEVVHVEAAHSVAARIHSGTRMHQLAIEGAPATRTLRRIVDRSGREVAVDDSGLVLSKLLGERLRARVGESVEVEILEGRRRTQSVTVAGFVDDSMGLSAYMELGSLHRLLREGDTVSDARLLIDPARARDLYVRLKRTPRIAGVTITDAARQRFRTVIASNFRVLSLFNIGFATIIAFGVMYNTARISLSERAHELASMRVLGYSIAEVTRLFLGDMALPSLLAVPIGVAIGWAVCGALSGYVQNELYRVTLVVTAQHVAWATLTVFVAGGVSCWAVARRLGEIDMAGVLKVRM